MCKPYKPKGLTISNLNEINKRFVSESEYSQLPGLRSTELKYLLRSVAHYVAAKERPMKQTASMRFGTLFHMAALEPVRFKESILIKPEFGGKGSVKAKEDFYAANQEKVIVDQEDYDSIMGMLKSLLNHDKAAALLSNGESEASYFWKDQEFGVDCKCRTDFVTSNDLVVDLKSTANASAEEFEKTIVNFGYHVSAAHYLQGISAATGRDHRRFIMVAVENEYPYSVQCFDLMDAAVEKGEELRTRAMMKYKDYVMTNKITAYSEDINSIGIPTWAYSK